MRSITTAINEMASCVQYCHRFGLCRQYFGCLLGCARRRASPPSKSTPGCDRWQDASASFVGSGVGEDPVVALPAQRTRHRRARRNPVQYSSGTRQPCRPQLTGGVRDEGQPCQRRARAGRERRPTAVTSGLPHSADCEGLGASQTAVMWGGGGSCSNSRAHDSSTQPFRRSSGLGLSERRTVAGRPAGRCRSAPVDMSGGAEPTGQTRHGRSARFRSRFADI